MINGHWTHFQSLNQLGMDTLYCTEDRYKVIINYQFFFFLSGPCSYADQILDVQSKDD